MASFIKSVPWTRQPTFPVGINIGNGLTKDLVAAAIPGFPECVSGVPPVVTGSVIRKAPRNMGGITYYSPTISAGQKVTWTFLKPIELPASDYTFCAYADAFGCSQTSLFGCASANTATDTREVGFQISSSQSSGIVNATATDVISGGTANGYPHLYTAMRIGGQRQFARDVIFTALGGTSDSAARSITQLEYGRGAAASILDNYSVYMMALWKRLLTRAEIGMLAINPWQIFAPYPTRLVFDASTVVPPAGTTGIFWYPHLDGISGGSIFPGQRVQ